MKRFLCVFLVLVLAGPAWSSWPTDSVLEIRTTGSDTLCGGGWSLASKGGAGVDYSQQNAAQYTYTSDLSGTGTATLTSAGSHFTSDIQGNFVQIVGQGIYCITGYTSTSSVTVDRNLATFSSATGYVGGALASPGGLMAKISGFTGGGGPLAFIQAGTYTMPNATNTSGGPVSGGGNPVHWVGYNSTRTITNTDATTPIFQPGQNSITMFSTQFMSVIRNIIITNPSNKTGITGINLADGYAQRCSVSGVANPYTTGGGNPIAQDCYAGSATGAGFNWGSGGVGAILRCVANACGSGGAYGFITSGSNATTVGSMALGCGGGGFNAGALPIIHCTAYGNTGAGFNLGENTSGGYFATASDCISYGNTTYGYAAGSSTADRRFNLTNCAGGANTTANLDSGVTGSSVAGFVALTANPFNNAAGGDFSLNNTAGGGALVRNAGVPGAFFGFTTTTSYEDIGAARHKDPAGGPANISFGLKHNPVMPRPRPRLRKAG